MDTLTIIIIASLFITLVLWGSSKSQDALKLRTKLELALSEIEKHVTLRKENMLEINELRRSIGQMEIQHINDIGSQRDDAVKKSKAVMHGQITEQLYPALQERFVIKDLRFLGSPIDYIAFEGMTAVRDGQSEQVDWVTFFDVKTGTSGLSTVQRRIRDAIKEGRVRWETIVQE